MIYIQLTNGFGNNLFQYNAARLLASHHGTEAIAIAPYNDYYGIKPLENVGVKFGNIPNEQLSVINSDREFINSFGKKIDKKVIMSGYFEDYRYYIPSREKIKSWFPKVEKRNNKDLVVHLRTGDRLFMKNEFYLKPKAQDFVRAIETFDFEQLHIVTDMPEWKKLTPSELKSIHFHTKVPEDQSVDTQESVDYFNSFVDSFKKYKPIVHNNGVEEDFTLIRTFDNIMFEHGTLSWWAAFLSDASMVGVYGPWRPWKKDSNKNLSQTPVDGWFQWK